MSEKSNTTAPTIDSAQKAANYLHRLLPKTPPNGSTLTYWKNGKSTLLTGSADAALLSGALAGITRGSIRMGDPRLCSILQIALDSLDKVITSPGENTEEQQNFNNAARQNLLTGMYWATQFGLFTPNQVLPQERNRIGFATQSSPPTTTTGRY